MKHIVNLVAALFSLLIFTGCEYEEPDFSNVRNVKVLGFQDGKLHASFDVDADNPNGFGFKVQRSLLDVYVDNTQIGTVELDDKVKIKRKSLRTYTVPVAMSISPLGMLSIVKSIQKDKVDIRLQGKVRGSVWGASKSFEVDEKRTIDGSMFKELSGMLNNLSD